MQTGNSFWPTFSQCDQATREPASASTASLGIYGQVQSVTCYRDEVPMTKYNLSCGKRCYNFVWFPEYRFLKIPTKYRQFILYEIVDKIFLFLRTNINSVLLYRL